MSGAVAMLLGNAYAPMTVSVSPTSVSGSSTGGSPTSNAAVVSVTGGSGQVSVAWSRTGGSSSVSAVSPTALSSAFTTSGLSVGAEVNASFVATVTDLVTGEVKATSAVSVYLVRDNPPLSASMSGNPNGSGSSYGATTVQSGTALTVSASGGAPPYSYNWIKVSSDPVSLNAGGASARPSVSVGPGQGYFYAGRCIVSDQIGQTVELYWEGLLNNTSSPAPPLSASANPASVGGFGVGADNGVTTEATNVTVSGAVGSTSISWQRVSGDGAAGGGFNCSFTHTFFGTGSASGTFVGTITDSLGRTTTVTVTANFQYWAGGGIEF